MRYKKTVKRKAGSKSIGKLQPSRILDNTPSELFQVIMHRLV
ncbi:hypothetical protein QGM71_06240 [Virgibacillus sp. C22-A2]|uniref:Uncharacterized protein n=1 Tax=Virgibacillus tibetensis TaxID=3042313 RepID=A0ABU6KD96_9BACI|nr:hypothetical protein [Virgibacillus sp. C22-A2]